MSFTAFHILSRGACRINQNSGDMLDVVDFIKERGGDPEKIRESQRRRYAKVEVVDEVIELYEDNRRSECTTGRVPALCVA